MASDDVPTRKLDATNVDPLPALPVRLDDPFATEGERYQQVGVLGEGGMGEIRLVRDARIARHVAVKVLKKPLREHPEFRARFLREARLQGQLEHPSIVPVHDLGETADGELFFSMKSIRGATLRDALRAVQAGDRQVKFSRRRLLSAFSNVCLTVDFAHSRGVVHRDLKPDNIMLGDFGEVYVLDWGIAKVMHHSETPIGVEIPTADDQTQAGDVLGTPLYMAPERREGRADPRTDVYALGVIMQDILEADGADVPPELASIAAKASAEDPARRYASARELHEALEQYLDGDRDLALRRTQAERHATEAESALQRARTVPEARTEAGRQIGRALGLDPSNKRALTTLMRLLTDVPAELPPSARAEADRLWRERRMRTLRKGTFLTVSILAFVPFLLWMGVRDMRLLLAFVGLIVAAGAFQWIASRTENTAPFFTSLVLAITSLTVLTTSMGLVGVVPASFAVVMMAWRMTVERWLHGLLILIVASLGVCAPFVLAELGVMQPLYRVSGDALIVRAVMHDFPGTATLVSMLLGTIGALAASILFGRVYASEIRRAEQRLTFHAWQLKQLVPE